MIFSMGVARGHVQIKSNADQMACQAAVHQAKCDGTRNYVVLHSSAREQALSDASLHWYGYTSGHTSSHCHCCRNLPAVVQKAEYRWFSEVCQP